MWSIAGTDSPTVLLFACLKWGDVRDGAGIPFVVRQKLMRGSQYRCSSGGDCITASTGFKRKQLMSTIQTDVLIVGAGPVGLLTALLLEKVGLDYLVVERRPALHIAPQAHIV